MFCSFINNNIRRADRCRLADGESFELWAPCGYDDENISRSTLSTSTSSSTSAATAAGRRQCCDVATAAAPASQLRRRNNDDTTTTRRQLRRQRQRRRRCRRSTKAHGRLRQGAGDCSQPERGTSAHRARRPRAAWRRWRWWGRRDRVPRRTQCSEIRNTSCWQDDAALRCTPTSPHRPTFSGATGWRRRHDDHDDVINAVVIFHCAAVTPTDAAQHRQVPDQRRQRFAAAEYTTHR